MAKKNKLLYIETDKLIPVIVNMYCNKSGLDSGEIGYLHGFINGNSTHPPIVKNYLINLLQHYFYAGIFYAIEHKQKVTAEYVEKDEVTRRRKVQVEKIQKQFGIGPKEEKRNYMG